MTSTTPATHQHAQHAQYAQRMTQRKVDALSAVYSAHAERTTQHTLNNMEHKQADKSASIESFEATIDRLYMVDDEDDEDEGIPQRILYRGHVVAEANALTIIVYGEKQKLIEASHRYINDTKQDKQELRMQIALADSRASDFEEQLEASLSEQDETDLQLDAAAKEIAALTKKMDTTERYGIPCMMLLVFYTYMCGSFGIGMVIYSHLWIIGMTFYTIGWSVQTSFMIGANTTGFLIGAGHVVCAFIVPA
jgi:hypothetical protein